ncbi:MAG: methyltransferase domain-containing protein [Bacteroidales bacterium]
MKKTQTCNGGRKRQTMQNHRNLGPVPDLEKHLQPDWWKRIFNSMYLKTDADVVEDRSITEKEVTLFADVLALDKDDMILDVACGQGRHSLELARRGYKNVHGIDRSHFLIRKAKTINQTEGLTVSFKEGDARKLPYSTDTFHKIMILGNSFGYFESKEDDTKILKEVFRIMRPGGTFLIDVADGNYLSENFNPRSWEWLDEKHFVCRERSLASDNERLISREVITHTQKGIIVDQFYAERLYSRNSLSEILKTAGFTNVQFHAEISPDSKRNQDLGMMERRIIVTAKVVKEWTPVRTKNADLKSIVVVMGDPGKPDVIKPDNIFDEDDINTINQLKIALSELKGYKFTYLNNHNSLINDLVKIKPKTDFVLNLCDEGFNNDAKMELHVPAILEILGIPYTGSNPQCLAYCYDKSLVRGIAKEMEIPVPEAFFIRPDDNVFELNIDFPVIVKPNFGDSSFGITKDSVAYSVEQLNDAIVRVRNQFGYDKPVLIEEFLTGREVTIGIIGNTPDSYMVLPVVEEDYSGLPGDLPKICGYEAKWLTDSPYFRLLRSIPADLPSDTEKVMVEHCLRLFERLECRDYCRFDWRLDSKGHPRLLEVNPNPGWCWDGHLAKMSSIAGLGYSKMLESILQAAETRLSVSMVNNLKTGTTVKPNMVEFSNI